MIRKLAALAALIATALTLAFTGCANTPASAYHRGDDIAIEDTTDPATEVTADPSRAAVVASLLSAPNTLDNNHDGVIGVDEQGFDCAKGSAGFVLTVDAAGRWGCGEN